MSGTGTSIYQLPTYTAVLTAAELTAENARLRARIAAALDALRTAPDLDTAEPSKAVLRRAHRAVSVAWAELADEAVSERQEVTVHRVGSGGRG